ncbi:morphogenic membrane protein MmpB [Streptomyces sp. NPDC007088]
MLWSDPRDEPPEELRTAERMLRRAGFVVALAMVLTMGVIGLGLL